MPYSVSSWFQVQLENIASEPVRKFSIGTSDYSDRVTRWPRIKRTINDLRSLKIGVPLDNTDGHFNGFYSNVYTIPNTATLQMGFGNPEANALIPQDNIDILKILDDCGDTSTITDWEEVFDGLNPADETALVKQGSHSMALGIDADKSVEDQAIWTNTQSQGDLSSYEHDWLYIWVYFPTLDYLSTGDSFTYYFGSDWTHYKVWSAQKANLTVGWNLLKFDIDNPAGATGVIDWSAIDLQRIRIITTVGNVNDFTVYIDPIMFVKNRELVTLYTGFLKNVSYKKESCELEFADNLYDFEKRKIGDSNVPASFAAQIPSDIAWTLCTCYGGKSAVASTSNPDIDYSSFLQWAAVMSAESLACEAQYDGVKVIEALDSLAQVTDSAIWVEGDGKINFLKYEEGSSLDITFMNSQFQGLEIDVESQRLVNKAYVPFNFSVESDYFQSTISAVDTASVNSFGIHEEIYKDETIWHTSSVDALVHGQRKVTLYHDPPRRFGVNLDLYGMRQKLGETVRLVDSFYNITSSDGFRLVETELDMDTGQLKMDLDEAAILVGFYLDQSYLDGTDLLL